MNIYRYTVQLEKKLSNQEFNKLEQAFAKAAKALGYTIALHELYDVAWDDKVDQVPEQAKAIAQQLGVDAPAPDAAEVAYKDECPF